MTQRRQQPGNPILWMPYACYRRSDFQQVRNPTPFGGERTRLPERTDSRNPSRATVTASLRNTGSAAGQAMVQAYLEVPSQGHIVSVDSFTDSAPRTEPPSLRERLDAAGQSSLGMTIHAMM